MKFYLFTLVCYRTSAPSRYVKVYLLPDTKRGGKRKTKAKRHSLNPDFDEVLEVKIVLHNYKYCLTDDRM